MESLVQTQPMPVTEPQPALEKLDACSQPLAAGLKPHLFYKCLLNQHAQKLRKPAPVYQTHNEGSNHFPKYRSTVRIDGVSYTSSNTFQQRKMAEMDASKVAYCAIMQKLKNEALHLIQEDKLYCKSILVEYAAKMDIEKPNYETIQQKILAPGALFRSSLVFNGVTYSGDIGNSKKEAEQLAARVAIINYLESESANDMSEIIHCKFRHNVASSSSGTHVGALTGVDSNNALNEAKVESGFTTMPKLSAVLESCEVQGNTVQEKCLTPVIAQQHIPIVSVEAATPAISVVTQTPVANLSIETIAPVVPITTQSPLSNVSIDTINSAVPAPIILPQIPSVEINNSSTPPVVSVPCLGQLDDVQATHISPDVIQPANSKPSSGTIVPPLPLASQALDHMLVMGQTSEKKRSRKNKKKAQKKMRTQMEISAMPMGEVPPCSSA